GTPEIKVIFNIYNVKNYFRSVKKPVNFFGNFARAEFTRDEYLEFYSNFLDIVPDNYMTLSEKGSRSCYERECSVYISSFHCTGTVVSKDSKIGVGDSKGKLTKIRKITQEKILESSKEDYHQLYTIEGSLIM